MTQSEFIKSVSEETGFTQYTVEILLESEKRIIKDVLEKGGFVSIARFGRFYAKNIKKHKIVALSGAPTVIPERKKISFRGYNYLKGESAND